MIHSCQICTKSFKTLRSINQHRNAMKHFSTIYRCPKCDAKFPTEDKLFFHNLRQNHRKKEIKTEVKNSSVVLRGKTHTKKSIKTPIIYQHEHEYILDYLRDDRIVEFCRICRKTRMKINHEHMKKLE